MSNATGRPTRWVVITGPPSSGKTTTLAALAERGFATSADSTRQLITEVVAAGRDAEEFRFADDFQPRVLAAMLAAEDRLDPDDLTFLEYAVPCNIAFHRTEGLALSPGLAEAATRVRYQAVFVLEPVGWRNDEQRVEDAAYQRAVHGHLVSVYRELGYDPVAVPLASVQDRVEQILDALSSMSATAPRSDERAADGQHGADDRDGLDGVAADGDAERE